MNKRTVWLSDGEPVTVFASKGATYAMCTEVSDWYAYHAQFHQDGSMTEETPQGRQEVMGPNPLWVGQAQQYALGMLACPTCFGQGFQSHNCPDCGR